MDHHCGPPEHILESEGHDDSSEMMQFAAPLGVALALRWSGVGHLAFDLDDHRRRMEVEVDPGERGPAPGVHHLARRALDARVSADLEEPPLERVRPTRVGEHAVDVHDARPSPAAEGGEPAGEERHGRAAIPYRRVDRPLQLARGATRRQIDDRAGRAGGRESVDLAPVDPRDGSSGVECPDDLAMACRSGNDHLDRAREEAFEPVERSGGPVAHECARAGVGERGPEIAPPVVRLTGEPDTVAACALEPALSGPAVDAGRRRAGGSALVERDEAILSGGDHREIEERLTSVHAWASARTGPERKPPQPFLSPVLHRNRDVR